MTLSKDLRISESTGRFIDILRKYNDLYSDVFAALCEIYNEEDCITIIDRDFCPEYRALEERLKALTMQSITNNIEKKTPVEI